MINKPLLAVFLALFILLGFYFSNNQEDPQQWLEDFDHLKQELAGGYANLEWVSERKHIDLATAARQTEEKLAETTSARKARNLIGDFLESFGDPHLKAERSEPIADESSQDTEWIGPSKSSTPKEALKVFGYRKSDYDFGIDFESVDGFEDLSTKNNPFPAGLLHLEDGRELGVIRIKYFGDDRYYGVAEETWAQFQPEIEEENCNSACYWRFTLQVRDRLMHYLQQDVELLQEADAVAIDVTANGGGTEWAEDVARLFTTKHLQDRGLSFVKHPHWEGQISEEIGLLSEDLAAGSIPPEIKTMLEATLAQHEELLAAIQRGCPASSLWDSDSMELDCSRLAHDAHGRYPKPDEAISLASGQILFGAIRHPQYVGVYDGPVFVVIDGGSASATEQFTTLLEYNDVATLIGEKTYGAGCGYTNGGIKVYLPNTGLRVWMSDCLRLRADGENELSGIEPDIDGWEPGDKGKTRARKLIERIAELKTW